ncbi:MAG: hypothetical protein IT378_24560, partial [Sandaracinaceae bacterium]|nr:hypothetical protein [Sandaracinaceae bacterium]
MSRKVELRCNRRFPGENAGYGFPVDFTIQLSEDNLGWATVAGQTGQALPPPGAQTF